MARPENRRRKNSGDGKRNEEGGRETATFHKNGGRRKRPQAVVRFFFILRPSAGSPVEYLFCGSDELPRSSSLLLFPFQPPFFSISPPPPPPTPRRPPPAPRHLFFSRPRPPEQGRSRASRLSLLHLFIGPLYYLQFGARSREGNFILVFCPPPRPLLFLAPTRSLPVLVRHHHPALASFSSVSSLSSFSHVRLPAAHRRTRTRWKPVTGGNASTTGTPFGNFRPIPVCLFFFRSPLRESFDSRPRFDLSPGPVFCSDFFRGSGDLLKVITVRCEWSRVWR